jgi:hypothetical protein
MGAAAEGAGAGKYAAAGRYLRFSTCQVCLRSLGQPDLFNTVFLLGHLGLQELDSNRKA